MRNRNIGLTLRELNYWVDPWGTNVLDWPMGNESIGVALGKPEYCIRPPGTKYWIHPWGAKIMD